MASFAVRPAGPSPACVAFATPRSSLAVRAPVDARATVVCEVQNSLRRQRVEARNAAYNKHYRDLIKSSSRAVLKEYQAFLTRASDVSEEAQLKPADEMMHKAFSNIDKAVVKGVMHKNTGARRKAKISRARQRVLIASGLYTPAPAA